MKSIREKTATYFEGRLYIGSKEGYEGEKFSESDLRKIIQEFQNSRTIIPVRITKTQFVAGDYHEEGWEVAVINYPRFPRPTNELYDFLHALAKHLLSVFKQNRISVVITNYPIYMYENTELDQECCEN